MKGLKEWVEDLESVNCDLLAELAKCHEIFWTLVDSVIASDTHTLQKWMDDHSTRFKTLEEES